jgi:hypothetical protein
VGGVPFSFLFLAEEKLHLVHCLCSAIAGAKDPFSFGSLFCTLETTTKECRALHFGQLGIISKTPKLLA